MPGRHAWSLIGLIAGGAALIVLSVKMRTGPIAPPQPPPAPAPVLDATDAKPISTKARWKELADMATATGNFEASEEWLDKMYSWRGEDGIPGEYVFGWEASAGDRRWVWINCVGTEGGWGCTVLELDPEGRIVGHNWRNEYIHRATPVRLAGCPEPLWLIERFTLGNSSFPICLAILRGVKTLDFHSEDTEFWGIPVGGWACSLFAGSTYWSATITNAGGELIIRSVEDCSKDEEVSEHNERVYVLKYDPVADRILVSRR
jgi:hypothetical protein